MSRWGQGTYTAIPMLIAEELDVELNQVRLEHAPPNERLYGNPLLGGIQATGNSNAIRGAWQPLREGAVIFGITAALYGKITLKGGRVEQTNFDNYQILRMTEAPKVEVYLVKIAL